MTNILAILLLGALIAFVVLIIRSQKSPKWSGVSIAPGGGGMQYYDITVEGIDYKFSSLELETARMRAQ